MQTVLLKAVNVQTNTMESIKWTYHEERSKWTYHEERSKWTYHEERSIATTLFFWKFNF